MSKALEKQRERLRVRLDSHRLDHSRQEISIKRVNETTRASRGIWVGLLAYMAFVGVTLVGIEDVDFFVPERQTTLPLVNVTVPTFLFMAIAPCLGALIYVYLHMHLMKHWEALAKLPHRYEGHSASDRITPWLVSDFALAKPKTTHLPQDRLHTLCNWVNIILVFFGTPAILFVFWYRSAVFHSGTLTHLCNLIPLIFSIQFGLVSWMRFVHLMKGRSTAYSVSISLLKLLNIIALLAFPLWGWLRTDDTLTQYAFSIGALNQKINSQKLFQKPFPWLVSTANLEGANFSNVPSTWLTPELDRISYRSRWCGSRSMNPSVCGEATSDDNETSLVLTIERKQYCENMEIGRTQGVDCYTFFRKQEEEFASNWQKQWDIKLNHISPFNFASADLKYANLRSSQLQRVDFREAELQGASIIFAHLQRSYMREAQLQGADLLLAQMQGADLKWAQLQGARLWETQLQGANLTGAGMQNTDLREAQLQGANLSETQLSGADLSGAQFNKSSSFKAANLRGASLRDVDFTMIPDFTVDLSEVFGDSTVKFPEGVEVPEHFNRSYKTKKKFYDAWRAFQKEIGFDPDDPSTWDKRKD